jgi:hypothetical protein
VTAASAAVAAARVRTRVSTDTIALAGLALLVGLLTVLTWGTWGDLGSDTGYDLVAAARVAHGDLPYVDFVYYYGPLAPFLAGAFAWLGGGGLGAALALGLGLSAAIVLATYALARRHAGPLGGFVAAALAAAAAFGPSNFSFVLPHTFSAPLAVLGLLCLLLALGRYAEHGDRRWLLAAGSAAGLVALTRPEFELAALVAAGAWLALRARAGLGGAREAAGFALPALGIPLLVYGAFLAAVPPHRLVFDNLYPTDTLRSGGNAALLSAPLTAGSFARLALELVLYAAGAAALVLAARLGRRALLPGIALAVVAAAGAIVRPETLRYGLEFAYGWIPAGAVLAVAVLLVRYRRREGLWLPSAQVELAGAIALAVVAAKTYAAFYVEAPKPQMAVYALPLAAVFLVRLHLGELARGKAGFAAGAVWLAFLAAATAGLTLKDARAETATVRGPGGALAVRPAEAPAYREALEWIAAGTRPGDPILLAPQLTGLYSLADRTDPLRELSLLPGALHDPAAERAAIARLDRAGVRLAVIDRRTFPEYGHTSFGGSFDRVLAGWLHEKFVHARTLRGSGPAPRTLDVWIRRGQ